MLFSYTFSGMNNTFSISPTNLSANTICIRNGIYDGVYIVNEMLEYQSDIPDTWLSDTILMAQFKGDLTGGNFNRSVSDTSAIRIKRKKHSELDNKWITIYEKEIITEDDFLFVIYDKYAKAKTYYDYGLVPVLKDGTEGAMAISTVYSDFNGIVICDSDVLYSTELNTSYKVQKNQQNTIVNTLSSKHPYIIHNAMTDYYSGTCDGFFIKWNNCELDFDSAISYREDFMEFMNNGENKILKFDDSRMWLVDITGNTSEDNSDHELKVITSFEWTEVGDSENAEDLYNAGLINKNPNDYETTNLPIQPIEPIPIQTGDHTTENLQNNKDITVTPIVITEYTTE